MPDEQEPYQPFENGNADRTAMRRKTGDKRENGEQTGNCTLMPTEPQETSEFRPTGAHAPIPTASENLTKANVSQTTGAHAPLECPEMSHPKKGGLTAEKQRKICRCNAYPFPHRPMSGGCLGGDLPPLRMSTIRGGVHSPKWRRKGRLPNFLRVMGFKTWEQVKAYAHTRARRPPDPQGIAINESKPTAGALPAESRMNDVTNKRRDPSHA